MLILSRNVSDPIRIGVSVSVRVLEVKAEQIRLGITAPSSTPIHRQEVADEIAAGKSQSPTND